MNPVTPFGVWLLAITKPFLSRHLAAWISDFPITRRLPQGAADPTILTFRILRNDVGRKGFFAQNKNTISFDRGMLLPFDFFLLPPHLPQPHEHDICHTHLSIRMLIAYVTGFLFSLVFRTYLAISRRIVLTCIIVPDYP